MEIKPKRLAWLENEIEHIYYLCGDCARPYVRVDDQSALVLDGHFDVEHIVALARVLQKASEE